MTVALLSVWREAGRAGKPRKDWRYGHLPARALGGKKELRLIGPSMVTPRPSAKEAPRSSGHPIPLLIDKKWEQGIAQTG